MAKRNKHIFVCGPTGSGKSTLIQSGLQGGYFPLRIHIIDPKDEHQGRVVTPEDMARDGNPQTFKTRSVPDTDQEFEQALAICHARGDCWVLCEEVGDYRQSEELRKLLRRGRSRGVHTICTTQRPAECHRTISAQAASIILYKMTEPRDVEYVRQRHGKETEADMASLEQYEFLVLGDQDNFGYYFRDIEKT